MQRGFRLSSNCFRLSQVKSGAVRDCGFCEPADCSADDVLLWMPLPLPSSEMTVDIAKYIVEHVGNRFCKLVEQEKEAVTWANLKGIVRGFEFCLHGVVQIETVLPHLETLH